MKRAFLKIRQDILKNLETGPKSITKIAEESGMTWKTAQRHLLWLERMEGKVKIIRKTKRKIVYKKIK
ncbi:MAG: ArsR family transcriptional regulator [Nanoarchaeota archaeon]|nr:ArsR family transcriptional regulator [Nanoarchaeota archaeon]MBU1135174.1 ArsR family transcriptional regulator [Nanoarchaeota archaeon]MBU2520527.1 ArsR family transcriptional regulator [Nanoarchaeota archaeon]